MISILMHANLQYAEIPKNEINKVVEKSYEPTIEALLRAEIPFGFNIPGFSLEMLPKKTVKMIEEGISSGLIEITGCAYTHAILPLLPLNRVERQIEKDKKVKEEIFGMAPKTFWPPELAYDPILPAILKEYGYKNVFVDGEALKFSEIPNFYLKRPRKEYPHLLKAQQGKRPIYLNYLIGLRELRNAIKGVIKGKVMVEGVDEIDAIPVWVPINIIVWLYSGSFPLMSKKRALKVLENIDNVLLYGSDIEFFGYRPIADKLLDVKKLIELIKELNKDIILPKDLPSSGIKKYLKTSSWAPDKSLFIWLLDPDNLRLNMLSYFMEEDIAFLAENSDARGWEPLAERKLDAFKAIYEWWRRYGKSKT